MSSASWGEVGEEDLPLKALRRCSELIFFASLQDFAYHILSSCSLPLHYSAFREEWQPSLTHLRVRKVLSRGHAGNHRINVFHQSLT